MMMLKDVMLAAVWYVWVCSTLRQSSPVQNSQSYARKGTFFNIFFQRTLFNPPRVRIKHCNAQCCFLRCVVACLPSCRATFHSVCYRMWTGVRQKNKVNKKLIKKLEVGYLTRWWGGGGEGNKATSERWVQVGSRWQNAQEDTSYRNVM